jgi:hypothetical protein
MSNIIDPTVKPALAEQFSLTRAKKAWGAGVGGLVTGLGAVSLSGIFADGKVDGTEVIGIITAAVGGFVLGFIGAWLPKNTGSPTDALIQGDGLAAGDSAPEHRA